MCNGNNLVLGAVNDQRRSNHGVYLVDVPEGIATPRAIRIRSNYSNPG